MVPLGEPHGVANAERGEPGSRPLGEPAGSRSSSIAALRVEELLLQVIAGLSLAGAEAKPLEGGGTLLARPLAPLTGSSEAASVHVGTQLYSGFCLQAWRLDRRLHGGSSLQLRSSQECLTLQHFLQKLVFTSAGPTCPSRERSSL